VMAADAVLYATGWMAIGLPYGLILGLFAGLLAIVPFVGPLFSVLLALAIGVTHWGGDLMALLPQEDWIEWSDRLIWHGRRVCDARKPRCSGCFAVAICPQVGVTRQEQV